MTGARPGNVGAASLVLAVLVACGGDRPASVGEAVVESDGSGSATVTYRPGVRLFEQAEGLAALRGVSTDGSTLLFDAAAPKLQGVQPGDVIVIKGLLARKVLGVQADGADVAVLVDVASLGEAIQDGRIALDAPIRFRRARAERPPARDRLLGWIVPEAHAQMGAERLGQAEKQATGAAARGLASGVVKGIFEGWETTFSAVPGDGRLNVSLELKKSVGGFKAVITGEGYVSDFRLASRIDVDDGIVQRLEMTHRKLNGVMNFRWEVAKDSPGAMPGDDRIKLPAALSIPLYQYLEGFPLFLEISAAIIIQPALSGGKEYSRGAFRITYDGEQSFQAKQGTIDSTGKVKGDIQFVESQNISALAPLGMVVAFAAPRIELTFGVSKIFKFSDIASAAKKVDLIAAQLVKRVLGQEVLDRLKSSPQGGLSLTKAVGAAMKSDAAAYIEMVTTAGMTHSGFSAIAPCTRTELALTVKVGASAQAFGQNLGETSKDIFKADTVRIDPPGTRLCKLE